MQELLMEDEKEFSKTQTQTQAQTPEATAEVALEDLPQGEYEINSHYRNRKNWYLKAVKEGFSKEKSLIIANVFQNYYYLGCVYKKEVMDMLFKSWPEGVPIE